MKSNRNLVLYHTAPRHVEVQEEPALRPNRGQVAVRTLISAISPGTERLLYRGEFPEDQTLDQNLPALSNKVSYPIKYGYSAVGEVIEVGEQVDTNWLDTKVFAFNPHESIFSADIDQLQKLPAVIELENAVFLPNVETAVNLVMDGSPLLGEKVLVLGQGIVGLLTTGILSMFPLELLVTSDGYEMRRQASMTMGASVCLDPYDNNTPEKITSFMPDGADLTYELTGNPDAIDDAIKYTGFDGRLVIGSWYGRRHAHVYLGGKFHRSRMRLVSSQVSTIAPGLSGRWSKERRFKTAWEMVKKLEPSRFITHRFNIREAGAAFKLLDTSPQETIQIVFVYD